MNSLDVLESDVECLIISFLEEKIRMHVEVKLSEIINFVKEEQLFSETFEEIDNLYNNDLFAYYLEHEVAIVIIELYFKFKDTGVLGFDDENEVFMVKYFTADNKSLENILIYLINLKSADRYKMKDQVKREYYSSDICSIFDSIYELKKWKKWQKYLDKLIKKINDELIIV